MSKASLFSNVKDYIARHYGNNPGKMLIHTGVIGWILSSAAQVVAIVINDKIPKEQKMFLVPQEIADAAVNIASFYCITQTFKSVAGKLVKTGKWLPKAVREFVTQKPDLVNKVGKTDFNILTDSKMPQALVDKFKDFDNGIDVIATTIGSILSCNIVTPLIRNEIAANRQKKGIERMNNGTLPSFTKINNPKEEKNTYIQRPSLQDFQTRGYSGYSMNSGSLKI